MIVAGQGTSTIAKGRFKRFQFAFATTIAHEVSHLLLTWLGKGRPHTPPNLTIQGYGDPDAGEAGRYFEMYAFGGTLEFYRDPQQDNRQVSPHDESSSKMTELMATHRLEYLICLTTKAGLGESVQTSLTEFALIVRLLFIPTLHSAHAHIGLHSQD